MILKRFGKMGVYNGNCCATPAAELAGASGLLSDSVLRDSMSTENRAVSQEAQWQAGFTSWWWARRWVCRLPKIMYPHHLAFLPSFYLWLFSHRLFHYCCHHEATWISLLRNVHLFSFVMSWAMVWSPSSRPRTLSWVSQHSHVFGCHKCQNTPLLITVWDSTYTLGRRDNCGETW